ncbi:MAG: zinc-binding dehydrogenase, partial [Calditrichaeota bacterium]|nr:zinc-binding dehydrogenase [Calditrichota bacterium]
LVDSLACIAKKGVVCMTGILGNEWTMPEFTPMGDIPSLGRLTVYMSDTKSLDKAQLQHFIEAVETGQIKLRIDPSNFSLDECAEAHRYMEANQAKGKIVITL